MKKLILVLGLVFITSLAQAESLKVSEILEKFPLKQGIAYSVLDSKINYLSTIEVFKLKKIPITFEIGTAGDAENTNWKAVGVISYPVLALDKYLDVPILNLIDVNIGIYGGMGKIALKDLGENDNSNELDWGISATLINIKF